MWQFLLTLGLIVVTDGARFMSEGRGASSGGGRVVGGGGKSNIREMSQMSVRNSLGEVIEILAQMLKEFSDQEIEDRENWAKYSKWSDDTEHEKK